MKITVIGSGYVGLVTGACFASLGFKVVCFDKDHEKIQMLQQGQVPIFEPGLDELLKKNEADGRIRYTTNPSEAVDHGDILFIAVGTPPLEDGSADLAHVLSVASLIGRNMKSFKLIVNKSTVPVGTADQVRMLIRHELSQRGFTDEPFDVVSNPEFLKEGAAIDDFMHPDRIVIGVDDGIHHGKSKQMLGDLYVSFNRHHSRIVWMDIRSAELTKYAANAMLATRISFMNEIANLADLLNADVDQIRRGIGSDNRIGPSFLYAGCGYGGSCFPKDTQALISTAKSHGQEMRVVNATEAVNERQKTVLIERLVSRLGGDLRGRNIAVWGLAFKPNTDDMREAPSRVIIKSLLQLGANVLAYDPIAGQEAMKALQIDCADHLRLLDRFSLVHHDMDALVDADALMVLTEWKNFHNPDFQIMKSMMRCAYILDGRNLYNPVALADLGIAYQGVGRRNHLIHSATQTSLPHLKVVDA
jgi:UDPglucose 6-dehydrogenase